MLNPWLILASLAFAVSFGVSLLMAQAIGGALITGAMAALTAFVTTGAVNWYRNHGMDARITALKQQIRLLQRQRANEQQAMVEMTAERERVAQALNSLQNQLRQSQLPGSVPQAQKAFSWNLSTSDAAAPPPPTPAYEAAEDDLNQFLLEAAATKQKITVSLNHLQAELSHLNAQISEHRQVRDHLAQEIQRLVQQQQQLTTSTQHLQAELEELERCRVELDQYISYVEAKKQELEAGANPLQQALKQLQDQVTALQAELGQLESQVTTRRTEKEQLDREIASLRKQEQAAGKGKSDAGKALQAELQQLTQQIKEREKEKSELEQQIAQLLQTQQSHLLQFEQEIGDREQERQSLQQQIAQLQTQRNDLQKLEHQIKDRRQEKESLEKQITQLQAQKSSLRHQANPSEIANGDSKRSHPSATQGQEAKVSNGKSAPTSTSKAANSGLKQTSEAKDNGDISVAEALPDRWTEFMGQLLDYELQTLKAIALESNPLRILNRLAEENFTTVDELVESINQRSQLTVGDRVIKFKPGFSPPTLLREHQKTIKKLIEASE